MKKRVYIILCSALAVMFLLGACGGGSKGGGSAVKTPDDFPGHKIAVQVATTAADDLNERIANGVKLDVSSYEKVTQCFDDLSLGRVDAVYVDSVVAAYYTKDNDRYSRVWLNDVGEPMGICLDKSSAELAAAVEAAIDMMFYDGSMADIAIRNFGDDFTAGLRKVETAPTIPTNFTTKMGGSLLVGSEIAYPPMEYTTDNGLEYIGFDIDVAKRIGEILGLQVEFVNTAWDGIFAGLEKGEYDCIISSVSITPERQERYILTEPYVANALCIVVKAGE